MVSYIGVFAGPGTAFCYAPIAFRRAGHPGVARKTHCKIFRDCKRYGSRVRFYDPDRFDYTSCSYESLGLLLDPLPEVL